MTKPTRSRRLSPLPWLWRVRHAIGYRELGLLAEAERELKAIMAPDRHRVEVVAEWTCLHQEQRRWTEMCATAAKWVQLTRGEPAAWIAWAYGTRRAESLAAAERILMEALLHHPHNATVHFNLGCYACQNGNLDQAQRRVVKAISLDPTFKALALQDPDLEPLRKAGQWPAT